MARQRRERGGDKKNEGNIPSPDLPPSYEDTIKNGPAGGFVDPTTTGELPVKTIVQVVQVRNKFIDHFLRQFEYICICKL